MNVLFATSEVFPFVKTGGLADVSQSLALALDAMGVNVTLIVPGYRSVLARAGTPVRRFEFFDEELGSQAKLLEVGFENSGVRVLLVSCPALFDRDGGPYADAAGCDWPDNPARFALYCRAVTAVLAGRSTVAADFDVVHCNDWQTGLIPALVREENLPVRSLFTIHNLAYQGVYDRFAFDALHLPEHWWHYEKLEFYANFSFLKAGVVYADQVTTVSPTYAREILQEPLACGMSGLLQHHRHKLHGILNGADYSVWNPRNDKLIKFHFDADTLPDKLHNKLDLQRSLGLRLGKSSLLVGMVSRLVHQKGVDWVVDVMQRLLPQKVQWVVLGAGDKALEQQLVRLAQAHPKQIAVMIGYDETLAHRIEAAADLFVMPSRYEPCGLNQIYSLRYGTLPLVRATGGLADTVVDSRDDTLKAGLATGFVYQGDSADDLEHCTRRAIGYFTRHKTWLKIQRAAMAQQFDWKQSAQQYIALYQQQ